jgi:hypothetical protein
MIRLVIPDSGPLISLAKIDRLDLLERFKCQIIITDVVAMEVTDGPDDAKDVGLLRGWLANRGNQISIEETTYGHLVKSNRELFEAVPDELKPEMKRKLRRKNSGELSIREFSDTIRNRLERDDSVLVLFEDKNVKSMSFGSHVHLMSLWSLAKSLEAMGVIPSADRLFDDIEDAGRVPPRDPFEMRSDDTSDLTQVYDWRP